MSSLIKFVKSYKKILQRFECKTSHIGEDNLEKFMKLKCDVDSCTEYCDYRTLYESWQLLADDQ